MIVKVFVAWVLLATAVTASELDENSEGKDTS